MGAGTLSNSATDASYVRKITNEKIEQNLKPVFDIIKKTAKQGKYSVTLEYELNEDEVSFLKKYGFSISALGNKYHISWES